jgi:2-polyprenyl-3-methyl-5-hydroxy-6-metoxy-1,4-benzoquinol methylase
MDTTRLILPAKGTLLPNDEITDPLKYYYHPIVGRLFRRRIEAGLSLLRPPYERVLEIGYGSGIVLPTLSQIGREVCGVDSTSDPDRTQALLKESGVRVQLFQGDICEWGFTGDQFDLVVAFSILEHIADPPRAMRRIAELLRPDGTLLIGVPRVDRLMAALFLLIGYRGIEGHHVTTYQDVLRCASPYFRLQRFSTFPGFLPRWASLYFNMVFVKSDAGGSPEPGR